jgi:hypothetical protein
MSAFSRTLTRNGYQLGQMVTTGVPSTSTGPRPGASTRPGPTHQGGRPKVPGLPPPPAGMMVCVDESASAIRTNDEHHGRIVVITECYLIDGIRNCSFYFLGESHDQLHFAPSCLGLTLEAIPVIPGQPGPTITGVPVTPGQPGPIITGVPTRPTPPPPLIPGSRPTTPPPTTTVPVRPVPEYPVPTPRPTPRPTPCVYPSPSAQHMTQAYQPCGHAHDASGKCIY